MSKHSPTPMPTQDTYDTIATAGLIAALAVVTIAQFFVPASLADSASGIIRGLLLIAIFVLASIALVRRRADPKLVFVLLVLCSVAALALTAYSLSALIWAIGLVTLGSFATEGPLTWILMAVGVVVPPGVALFWGIVPAIAVAAASIAVVASAIALRDRRRYVESLIDQASIAEERSEFLARSAREQERERIARDLHDSVAQTLAIIAANAAGAARVVETDPEQGKQSLEAISRTAREAAQDLRNTVFELRQTDADAHIPTLEELAGRLRDVGQQVELIVHGDPSIMPPAIAGTLNLVAREALTNALKYGDRETIVRARLDVQACDANLRISNCIARTRGVQALGNGICSMRERMQAQRGTLEVIETDHEFCIVGRISWR